MLQAAAQALTALARIVDGDVDRGTEVAAFDRAVARMDALDDATVAADLDAALQIGRAQLRLQRAAGAAATFTRALDVCRRAHRGELVVHLLAVRTIARWLLLDLDGALADATAVEEGARLYGGSHQVLLATWLLALVHHHRGEVAEAERAAGAFTPLAASLPPCEPVRAGACTLATIPVDRDPERCVREILELGGADLEHAEHGWAGSALPALVRAAVATGRTEEAEQWAALATGRTLNLPANEVRAALARAEVRLARGEAGAAAALATRAATVADAIPAPLDAAEARLLAGRALAAAGRPEEAKRALQRVAADAGRGRAGRLHHQAARELRRLGTRVSGPGRRVAHQPLSPRERRIADLVAGGSANKEVAAALFLSPKTVENALTRIYAKLGIRERRELPRALAAPSS
jgi:ATP/maltotriose-dependent transcriptional regulator MalT